MRGLLAEAGIATFVPDEMTKIVDPFITGSNPFQEELQVPAEDLERARAVVADRRTPQLAVAGEAASAGGAQDAEATGALSGIDDFEPEPGDEPAKDPVEDRAFLTILFAVLVLTLPLAVISGVGYVWAWRRTGRRSRNHGWALLALAAPFLIAGLGWLLYVAQPPPTESGYPKLPPLPRRPPFSTPIGPR